MAINKMKDRIGYAFSIVFSLLLMAAFFSSIGYEICYTTVKANEEAAYKKGLNQHFTYSVDTVYHRVK